MSLSVPDKIKNILFNPTFAFRKVRDERARDSIQYLLTLTAVYAGMSAVMAALTLFVHPFFGGLDPGSDPVTDPFIFAAGIITILVVTLAIAVVFGLWLHLFVYLLGGRKGVRQTEKTVIYSLTPTLIMGWIPMIGPLIGGIWSVLIAVIGLKELQDLPDTKSALAVILAILIAGFLILVLFWAMIIAMMPMFVNPV
ncbi:MAG: YIP1 family protein [Methanolinea sp.]|nr:YIP1 family protein [Methanolinea sp.]